MIDVEKSLKMLKSASVEKDSPCLTVKKIQTLCIREQYIREKSSPSITEHKAIAEYKAIENSVKTFKDPNTLGIEIDALRRKIRKLKSKASTDRALVKGLQYGSDLFSAVIKAASVVPGVDHIIDAASYVRNEIFNWSISQIDEDSKKQAVKLVSKSLKILRDKYKKNLNEMTGLSAKERVKEVCGVFNELQLKDYDNNIQPAINFHLSQIMENCIDNQISLNTLADKAQDEDIQQAYTAIKINSQSLLKLNKSFTEVNKNIHGGMRDINAKLKSMNESIQKSIKHNSDRLDEQKKQLDEQGKQIGFLSSFMFDSMSYEQQKKALDDGFQHPDMSEQETAAYQAKLALIKRKKEFIENTQTVLNGAALVVNIARGLGVDTELAGKLEEGVEVGNAAIEVFTSLSAGGPTGYMNAASIVTGMVLNRGKGAETYRHEQIVNKLMVLEKNQEKLLRGQKDILKTLDEVIGNQYQILQSVYETQQMIQENHADIMKKLNDIEKKILFNRTTLAQIMHDAIDPAREFLESRKYPEYDFSNGHFHSYEALVFHYNNPDYKSKYKKGFKGLSEVIDERDHGLHIIFHLKTYAKPQEKSVSEYIKKIFEPSHRLWIQAVNHKNIEMKLAILSLLIPCNHIELNFKKIDELQLEKGAISQELEFIKTNLGEPCNPLKTIEIGGWLCELHYYPQLYDTRMDMEAVDALIKKKKFYRTGYHMLSKFKKIVNLAIVQQGILSGDLLLPYMTHVLGTYINHKEHDDKKNKANYESVRKLLGNSQLLSLNWSRYLILTALKEHGLGLSDYLVALNMTNVTWLLNILGKVNGVEVHWNIENENKQSSDGGLSKKSIVFKSSTAGDKSEPIKIRLPSMDDLHENVTETHDLKIYEMQHTNEMHELLAFKSRLIETMLDYDLEKDLSARSRAFVRDAVILSH